MRVFISFLFLTFFFANQAFAGPWPQPLYGGFFKLDFTSIRADQFFSPNGDVIPLRTLGNYTSSIYGEFGFTDRLTGIAYVPFYVRNTLNRTEGRQSGQILEEGVSNDAFGDVNVGVKYGLIVNKPVVLSASLTLGLPTGDADNPDGLLTGDGEFNQLVQLEAGTGRQSWWASAGVGFNNRTNGFSDEFRYDLEFGVKLLNDRLLAIMKINGIESFQNGDAAESGNGLFSNNMEFLAFNPEVSYLFSESWGATLRFGGAVSGQNVLAAPALSAGVFYNLR